MRSLSKALVITGKDALAEIRTRDVLASVLVFTVLVIIIFNFAFTAGQEAIEMLAPGILWATFTFAGILSLNRAFLPEKEQGCLEGLMLCPVSRDAIYLGKMLASLLFMLIIEAIAVLVFGLLFNLPVLSPQMAVITLLGTVGFAAVGTLFSALAVNTRAREMVLPILFIPISIPLIVAAVKASALALAGEPWGSLATWLQVMAAFDVVFLVVSYLVFAHVIEE